MIQDAPRQLCNLFHTSLLWSFFTEFLYYSFLIISYNDISGGGMPKLLCLLAVAALVLWVGEVLAGEGPQAGGPDQSRIQQIGLIIDLPEIRPRDLVNDVYALRSDLQARRQVLEELTANAGMHPAEVVLAVALPGGSLYAAYKVQLKVRRKERLERIAAEIAELGDDLDQLALIVGADAIMLARASR